MNGREVIGSCVPEMLVADADFPMSVVSVTIAATADGEISLKRGSVLAADDTDGTCSLLSGSEGTTAAYILAEPVMTSITEDVIGVAYETGKFITQSLIVADGYQLSVKDRNDLRNAGILMEGALM
ncbi:MAG TPA: hypothetical protein DEB74_10210 [Lachnospiraceae bacterium]|jgi:hypothetical protein|nr:hypothetical protein [Lachnospiraceae bacterium]